MPLPEPQSGETQSDFIGRCVSNDQVRQDFDSQEQRLAVCHDIWRRQESMNLDNLLTDIRARKNREGVLTADRYVAEITQCFGGACPLKTFELNSEAEWKRFLKEAESKLTYSDRNTLILPETVKRVDERQDGGPRGIMEFEAVITTPRKDRDGDILDPLGMTHEANALLWQHISIQPVGGVKAIIEQNEHRVRGRFLIADTELGRDAAALIEAGALRMSHGFEPTDFDPLQDGSGYHFRTYNTVEDSLVSIPSNVDAVITAERRNQLRSAPVVMWAKSYYDNRPVQGKGFEPEKKTAVSEDEQDKSHMPPIIQSVVGSWEWIEGRLDASSKDWLSEHGLVNDGTLDVTLIATWQNRGIVCEIGAGRPFSEDRCFQGSWRMVNGAPQWRGEPQEVELVAEVRERAVEVAEAKGISKEPPEDEASQETRQEERSYSDIESELLSESLTVSEQTLKESITRLQRIHDAREVHKSNEELDRLLVGAG